MSINRKRFRVEQAILGDAPTEMPALSEADTGPMHHEIMNELRAIRAQMAAPARQSQTTESLQEAADRELAETQSLLETYRAQIEQCEKI
jgi:chemotaxis protein CheZ